MDTPSVMDNRRNSNNRHWNKPHQDQSAGPAFSVLLPIEQSGGINTVNARDLHAVLGSRQDFSTWIKGRVKTYEFQKGVDFTTLHKSVEPGNTSFQTAIEYHVSLDMAKELAMVENTPTGRLVRRYFIDAERQLRGAQAPTTLVGALELALSTERARLALESEAETLRPKAAFADAVAATDDTMSMAVAAQKLGTGQNRLYRALRAADVLIKHGQRYNLPYQHHIDVGRFVVAVGTHDRPDGIHNHATLRVTAKGLIYLHGLFGQ